MDDYIVKPTRREELAAKLARWMRVRPAPGGPAIDRSVLAELTGGNIATEDAVLAEFVRCSRNDAADFARAVATGDIVLVTRIAHRMRGAGAAVGASGLARVCGEIESAGRADDWQGIRLRTGALEVELGRIGSELETEPAPRAASSHSEP
jgi:HPt (histidine-containing phosphotransfer) domain-containing protein